MRKRYVLEGTWSGYTSSQERVCHRTITRYPEKYKELGAITFTDGTCLYLSLREAKPREKIREIHGYDSLISDCVYQGVSSVSALKKYQKAEVAS